MVIPQRPSHQRTWLETAGDTLMRHISFLGPGLIAAVAYCDPGNWATDMEAGSRFGYKLLFTVLLSGLFAVLLQVLCCRLGAVTGLDLSTQTRRLVLGLPAGAGEIPPMNTMNMRFRYWGLLIPLYIINEVAIVATELAELIGSAIALNLLFPVIPLWAGVLITTADVFLALFLFRPSSGVRLFEALIGVLVLIVLVCFCILLRRVLPNWGDVFYGFVPTSTVVTSEGLYISISILGATIMPHSLILGSHFATIDRLDGELDPNNGLQEQLDLESEEPGARLSFWRRILPSNLSSLWRRTISSNIRVPEILQTDELPPHKPVSLRYLNIILQHSSWDIAICLVLFAITINSAILIVASAAFHYGNNSKGDREVVGDLFQAFELLKNTIGTSTAILFAVALLAAGESSSITVTLAGQIISEGFIRWRITPFMRRFLTRAIAVIPAMLVAAIAGRNGLDTMLVASQVALSMALPFISFPLLVITCSPYRMTREILEDESAVIPSPHDMGGSCYDAYQQQGSYNPDYRQSSSTSLATGHLSTPSSSRNVNPPTTDAEDASLWCRCLRRITEFCWPRRDYFDGASGKYFYRFHCAQPIAILSWSVFLVICIADVYVLQSSIRDPSKA